MTASISTTPPLAWPCPAHALVIGASRGIGLALVDALLAESNWQCVFAVCRAPEHAAALQALALIHPSRLQILAADTTNPASLAALAAACRERVDSLHLIIHTPGLLHDASIRPEKALSQLKLDSLARSFAVNTFGPILVAQALLPLLPRQQRSCFASLSARVSSIGDNKLGGWYSYRAAKAAQNQLLHTWSIELQRSHPQAAVLLLHPGTVATGLSQPFQATVDAAKLFTPEFAAKCLLHVINRRSAEDSGRLFDWNNQIIPW